MKLPFNIRHPGNQRLHWRSPALAGCLSACVLVALLRGVSASAAEPATNLVDIATNTVTAPDAPAQPVPPEVTNEPSPSADLVLTNEPAPTNSVEPSNAPAENTNQVTKSWRRERTRKRDLAASSTSAVSNSVVQPRTETGPAAEGRDGRRQPNNPTREFASFKIISERNIFDPNRRSRRSSGPAPKPKVVDSFGLVGVMSYEKGTFAFFDGSSSQFKKVLKTEDEIAGYKLMSIAPNAVKLSSGTNELTLPIGGQLRREEEGEWLLSTQSEAYAASSSSISSEASASTTPASGPDNDTLKKMRERREKE